LHYLKHKKFPKINKFLIQGGDKMGKKLFTFSVVFVASLFGSGPIWADLILEIPSPSYQQTENSPCVIGDPSCKNGGFSYTQESGPAPGVTSAYDLTSPTYTVVAGTAVSAPNGIPTSFLMGYDINYAGGQDFETLQLFETYVNGALVTAMSYYGPTNVSVLANGNGFSDAVFSGFNFSLGDHVYFRAKWTNDTDGMEEFFIIPQGTPTVPEPATLILFGLGLVGLAGVRKIRK
jgi:hypothetical protein